MKAKNLKHILKVKSIHITLYLLSITLKMSKLLILQINQKNLDKGIGLIQSGIGMLGEFGKALGPENSKRHSKNNQDVRSAFWGEPTKGNRKDSMPFYGKKMNFSSNDKVDFW